MASLPVKPEPGNALDQRSWADDVLSFIALCLLAGFVLSVVTGMAREVFEQVFQLSSFQQLHILRGLS